MAGPASRLELGQGRSSVLRMISSSGWQGRKDAERRGKVQRLKRSSFLRSKQQCKAIRMQGTS